MLTERLLRLALAGATCLLALAGSPGRMVLAQDVRAGDSVAVPAFEIAQVTTAAPRVETVRYTVEKGDTVEGIARQHGLKPNTLIWANPDLEFNPNVLRVGQVIEVPVADGVLYTVGEGDTLEAIAARFGVTPETIAAETAGFAPGARVLVRNGVKLWRAVKPGADISELTRQMPLGLPARGSLSRGYTAGHPGMDIAMSMNTPVLAMAEGVVVFAGWDKTGYGNMVWLDHGNGFRTLYAHLNSITVSEGQRVKLGAVVGMSGNSGNSLGPHLHIELSHAGVKHDPAAFFQ
jgi:murein DD-endopeptidase MepM/ murein hydrolase activator NlpD